MQRAQPEQGRPTYRLKGRGTQLPGLPALLVHRTHELVHMDFVLAEHPAHAVNVGRIHHASSLDVLDIFHRQRRHSTSWGNGWQRWLWRWYRGRGRRRGCVRRSIGASVSASVSGRRTIASVRVSTCTLVSQRRCRGCAIARDRRRRIVTSRAVCAGCTPVLIVCLGSVSRCGAACWTTDIRRHAASIATSRRHRVVNAGAACAIT